jgi:hypothetical protein
MYSSDLGKFLAYLKVETEEDWKGYRLFYLFTMITRQDIDICKGDAKRQTKNRNQRIKLPFHQVSPSNFEVILNHVFCHLFC